VIWKYIQLAAGLLQLVTCVFMLITIRKGLRK
jgi:hypothetical protein